MKIEFDTDVYGNRKFTLLNALELTDLIGGVISRSVFIVLAEYFKFSRLMSVVYGQSVRLALKRCPYC